MLDKAPAEEPHGFAAYVHDYLIHDWPSLIFVAAVVIILARYMPLVDAIDAYAWLVIGNLASDPEVRKQDENIVVVSIDEDTNRDQYRDRSPLDRCALRDHLRLLYDAQPSVLAIDIDLAPAVWLMWSSGDRKEPQADCEKEIYELIGEKSCAGTTTILMRPFERQDENGERGTEALEMLRAKLGPEMVCKGVQGRRAKVEIGDATLPVEYGILFRHYTGGEHFAHLIYRARQSAKGVPKPLVDSDERKARTDPRTYMSGAIREISLDDVCREPSLLNYKVVLFGAAFGEHDQYLTPLARVYGVHAHAAAYLSMFNPISAVNKRVEKLGKLVLALVFGLLIAYSWEKYFDGRIGSDPLGRQLAPLHVVLLLALVLLAMILVSLLSLTALRRWGIWLSPLPIAIGMLVECFIVGSVSQARHEMLRMANVRSYGPKTLWESIQRFVWGDFWRLWTRKVSLEELRLDEVPALMAIVRTQIRIHGIGGLDANRISVELQQQIHEYIDRRSVLAQVDSAARRVVRNRVAAAMVAGRRVLWAGVVLWAFG